MKVKSWDEHIHCDESVKLWYKVHFSIQHGIVYCHLMNNLTITDYILGFEKQSNFCTKKGVDV